MHSCFDEGCIHWTDTSGHRIEAHGAGLSQSPLDGRWYWYGESKKYPQASTLELGSLRPVQTFTPYGDPWKPPGVNVYSAHSIAGPWQSSRGRRSGRRLPTSLAEQIRGSLSGPRCSITRNSRHFVMWVHLEDSEYQFRHAGVAISETATGPFKLLHALQPDGIPSLDMSLFLGPLDGQAHYFIRPCDNTYTGISRMSAPTS